MAARDEAPLSTPVRGPKKRPRQTLGDLSTNTPTRASSSKRARLSHAAHPRPSLSSAGAGAAAPTRRAVREGAATREEIEQNMTRLDEKTLWGRQRRAKELQQREEEARAAVEHDEHAARRAAAAGRSDGLVVLRACATQRADAVRGEAEARGALERAWADGVADAAACAGVAGLVVREAAARAALQHASPAAVERAELLARHAAECAAARGAHGVMGRFFAGARAGLQADEAGRRAAVQALTAGQRAELDAALCREGEWTARVFAPEAAARRMVGAAEGVAREEVAYGAFQGQVPALAVAEARTRAEGERQEAAERCALSCAGVSEAAVAAKRVMGSGLLRTHTELLVVSRHERRIGVLAVTEAAEATCRASAAAEEAAAFARGVRGAAALGMVEVEEAASRARGEALCAAEAAGTLLDAAAWLSSRARVQDPEAQARGWLQARFIQELGLAGLAAVELQQRGAGFAEEEAERAALRAGLAAALLHGCAEEEARMRDGVEVAYLQARTTVLLPRLVEHKQAQERLNWAAHEREGRAELCREEKHASVTLAKEFAAGMTLLLVNLDEFQAGKMFFNGKEMQHKLEPWGVEEARELQCAANVDTVALMRHACLLTDACERAMHAAEARHDADASTLTAQVTSLQATVADQDAELASMARQLHDERARHSRLKETHAQTKIRCDSLAHSARSTAPANEKVCAFLLSFL